MKIPENHWVFSLAIGIITPTNFFERVSMKRLFVVLALGFFTGMYLAGCHNPQPGPDKSIGGMALGAGWGAGAGAVVGNQVSNTGGGAAVGAGFGAVAGLMGGISDDLQEGAILDQQRELAALKVQNLANGRQLQNLQDRLDRAVTADLNGGVYQVFFDADATNLRAGAIANIEIIADSIKQSAKAYKINVVGHADDAGTPDYNERLAEARARAVSAYLSARGISADQISVTSHGSKRPLATNGTPEGRQLNRRVDIYIGK